MPNVVEANRADPAMREGGLEALEQAGAADRLAGVRMREHEVAVASVTRLLIQPVELTRPIQTLVLHDAPLKTAAPTVDAVACHAPATSYALQAL